MDVCDNECLGPDASNLGEGSPAYTEIIIPANGLDTLGVAYALTTKFKVSGYAVDADRQILTVYPPIPQDAVDAYVASDEFNSDIDGILAQRAKDSYKISIANMCDVLTRRFKIQLAGRAVSPEQQERYQVKATTAASDNINILSDEAAARGISVERLSEDIIGMSVDWTAAAEIIYAKIEASRIILNQYVDSEVDLEFISFAVRELLSRNKFDDNTTAIACIDTLKTQWSNNEQ